MGGAEFEEGDGGPDHIESCRQCDTFGCYCKGMQNPGGLFPGPQQTDLHLEDHCPRGGEMGVMTATGSNDSNWEAMALAPVKDDG